MKYIHSKDFIHWDLKPSNILVRKGEVKICDFGLTLKSGRSLHDIINAEGGTILYQAPE